MRRIFIYIIALFLIGCEATSPIVIKQEDAGKVLSAQPITGAFNDRNRTQITTDSYILIVVDSHSVKIGAPVTLFEFDTGRSCVFVGDIPEYGVRYEDCWILYE